MIHWPRRAAVPAGLRVYAIAPLGGRIAALDDALARIDRDGGEGTATGEATSRRIVLLGGLVDGPDAASLVMRAMCLAADPDILVMRGPAEDAVLAGGAGGWPSAEDIPASILHWLWRRPGDGYLGDYRFAGGQVTAFGRAIAGDVVALEGRRRRRL